MLLSTASWLIMSMIETFDACARCAVVAVLDVNTGALTFMREDVLWAVEGDESGTGEAVSENGELLVDDDDEDEEELEAAPAALSQA